MTKKEMLNIVIGELSIFYNSIPAERSLKKIKDIFQRFKTLKFEREDIIYYIDFCYKQMEKTVKDAVRRSSVDYFVAIVSSDKTFLRYLDYLRAKGEVVNEPQIEVSPYDDPNEAITFNGLTYHKIISTVDRDIFLCPTAIKFLIRDYNDLVPRFYTLMTYNVKYPDKKITWETIKDIIKESDLCPI